MGKLLFFPFFFPLILFIMFTLLFSLLPSRNAEPGSHSRLFFPPTHYGSCLARLSREDCIFSLVDSRRIVLTHARRSQQLILFFFFLFATKCKISPRRDSKTRTNTSSIRGLPLVNWGDNRVVYITFENAYNILYIAQEKAKVIYDISYISYHIYRVGDIIRYDI